MASEPLDEDIFAQLRKPLEPKVLEQREKDVNDRIHAQYEKTVRRQTELVGLNSTKPVTISSVRVLHAKNTRRSFLERIFHPILAQNTDTEYDIRTALSEIGIAVDKLNRLDIFQPPISTFIDKPDPTDPTSTPTDHAVFISAKEKPRYSITTGTWAGNSEGDAYLNVLLRNIFGGAERLRGGASLGTRTRSAYNATLDAPILSNPDLRWEIGGLASSTVKEWASHEDVIKGGNARLTWQTAPGHRHELQYSGLWRQVTGLAENASPTIRVDAGDSFKSSLTHSWINDTRDSPLMPARGYLFKAVSELAGLGPLKGDVSFAKFEVQSQAALPIPIPGLKGESGISFTAGLRGGLITPVSLPGQEVSLQNRINDRFQLGGPNDVRGFRLSGLGPRDGRDAVGGDIYAAGGASLLLPLPGVGKDTPVRLQAFINGGRLLALKDTRKDLQKPLNYNDVVDSVGTAVNDIVSNLPSTAAGIGLVYAHPVARFEVNFSLPLVIRKGEEARKGISFGVGIDFL